MYYIPMSKPLKMSEFKLAIPEGLKRKVRSLSGLQGITMSAFIVNAVKGACKPPVVAEPANDEEQPCNS